MVVEDGDASMWLKEFTVGQNYVTMGWALRDSGIEKETGAIIFGMHRKMA